MIRVALVGAGGIGNIWAKALAKSDRLSVQVVVDGDESRASKIAESLNATPLTDWKEAVSHVDAAIIAVPHVFLAPVSRGFLESGKHVLCEKPCGIKSVEVAENASLARENNLIYMPGFNHRYHAAYMEAKKRFDAGEIGELMFIRARHGFGGRKDYEKEWRFNKDIAGGGELMDQGMHMIDLARQYLGDITETKGFAENLFWGGDVEDNGFALLKSVKGKVAQIHVSWTNWDWIHCFEIFGTKGYLQIDGLDTRYRGPERLTIGQIDARSGAFPTEEVIIYANETKEDSFLREVEAFVDAIEGKSGSTPKGEDAVEALKIVEMIYNQVVL